MRFFLVFALMITATILSACGGDDKPIILQPDPIPDEYAGLSMAELKEKSSGLPYIDILGDTEQGIYKSPIDPEIAKSILKHKGTLVYFEGMIEEIYPSSQEGIYTFWLCTSGWDQLRKDGIAVVECGGPLFVLYSLDLGPELKKGDMIKLAATIFGSRPKQSRDMNNIIRNPAGRGQISNAYTSPEVSAIKVEYLD